MIEGTVTARLAPAPLPENVPQPEPWTLPPHQIQIAYQCALSTLIQALSGKPEFDPLPLAPLHHESSFQSETCCDTGALSKPPASVYLPTYSPMNASE